MPGVRFTTVLTPINDAERRRPVRSALTVSATGSTHHIRMLDYIDAGNTGVMMLHDGSIRGGDAVFDYIGADTAANGRWKGELINREHTTAKGERPLFGGHEVGIGFSGTATGEGVEGGATALAARTRIRFKAVLLKSGWMREELNQARKRDSPLGVRAIR